MWARALLPSQFVIAAAITMTTTMAAAFPVKGR